VKRTALSHAPLTRLSYPRMPHPPPNYEHPIPPACGRRSDARGCEDRWVIVRDMVLDDLPALIELQQAGAVVGMAAVFPQDRHPFPRETILARWREELAEPEVDVYAAVENDGVLVGFAATCGSELLHFGTAIETWGQGTAGELLGVVVELLQRTDAEPTLRVFADNGRARRFYEKHGWRATGRSSVSSFEPNPVLLEYALPDAPKKVTPSK
jgi:RimJ/RimL family protein N-acetyltransferase